MHTLVPWMVQVKITSSEDTITLLVDKLFCLDQRDFRGLLFACETVSPYHSVEFGLTVEVLLDPRAYAVLSTVFYWINKDAEALMDLRVKFSFRGAAAPEEF